MKLVFRAAKRDGYLLEDPADFADTVRDEAGEERKPFAIPEIQRVLEVADPEWKSLILFRLYTGQRLADLAVLTWDNVDLLKNEIRLRTHKTCKRLILPIAPALRSHLDSLPYWCEPASPLHPWVFDMVKRQGRSGNLSNQFGQLLAEAGFREKKTHEETGKGRDGRRASNVFELS